MYLLPRRRPIAALHVIENLVNGAGMRAGLDQKAVQRLIAAWCQFAPTPGPRCFRQRVFACLLVLQPEANNLKEALCIAATDK